MVENISLWASVWGLLVLLSSTLYQLHVSKRAKKKIIENKNIGDDKKRIKANFDVTKRKSESLGNAMKWTFGALILSYALSIAAVVSDDSGKQLESLESRVLSLEQK